MVTGMPRIPREQTPTLSLHKHRVPAIILGDAIPTAANAHGVSSDSYMYTASTGDAEEKASRLPL